MFPTHLLNTPSQLHSPTTHLYPHTLPLDTSQYFHTSPILFHPLSVAYAYAVIASGKESSLAIHIRSMVKTQKSRSVFAGGPPQSLVCMQPLPSVFFGGTCQSKDALRELVSRKLVSMEQAQALMQAVSRAEQILRSDDVLSITSTDTLHDHLNHPNNRSEVSATSGVNGGSGISGVSGGSGGTHRGKLKNVRVDHAIAQTRETRAIKKQQPRQPHQQQQQQQPQQQLHQQQQPHQPQQQQQNHSQEQKFESHSVGLHADLPRTERQKSSLMTVADKSKDEHNNDGDDKDKDKKKHLDNDKHKSKDNVGLTITTTLTEEQEQGLGDDNPVGHKSSWPVMPSPTSVTQFDALSPIASKVVDDVSLSSSLSVNKTKGVEETFSPYVSSLVKDSTGSILDGISRKGRDDPIRGDRDDCVDGMRDEAYKGDSGGNEEEAELLELDSVYDDKDIYASSVNKTPTYNLSPTNIPPPYGDKDGSDYDNTITAYNATINNNDNDNDNNNNNISIDQQQPIESPFSPSPSSSFFVSPLFKDTPGSNLDDHEGKGESMLHATTPTSTTAFSPSLHRVYHQLQHDDQPTPPLSDLSPLLFTHKSYGYSYGGGGGGGGGRGWG